MKKLIAMALAALAAGFVLADEEVTMVEKEITTVTVPFGIKGYIPSNKDVVRIEKVSDTSLRLTALKSGRCDLEVRGDLDMTQKFQISVGGDLPKLLDTLQRELESVPEVHARILGDKIRIDGEIKSIKKWNYLDKVIKGYPSVRNFVEFTPGDDILIRMKESLQQGGFGVVFNAFSGEPETWKANTVALAYNKINRQMSVQAKVYTPEQQALIMECFKKEKRWLKIDTDDKEAFDDEKQITGIFKIVVAKPQIRLSVAYMAIGEDDVKKIGNAQYDSLAFGSFGFLQIFRDIVNNETIKNATIGAEMSIFTRFLKEQQIKTVSDTGYTVMESWAKDGAKFKSGGTLFVKVEGRDIAELKEIPYGFTIDAKGGMVDEKMMSVDFDFGLSSIMPSGTGEYDRKEDLSKQKITLPIGRTTLISGFKDLVDKNTPPSGLPILRNTPLLNWFVADSGKEVNDKRLVIMVCPEIVDNTRDSNLKVNEEINIPVQKVEGKTTDDILEERKEFTGFWSWLNWFAF